MEVSYKNYDQKTVHNSISSKLPGEKRKKRTGDPIWELKIGDVDIDTIRYPNSHKGTPFPIKESKRIAKQLRLEIKEYNDLIDCPLKEAKLNMLLEKRFQDQLV